VRFKSRDCTFDAYNVPEPGSAGFSGLQRTAALISPLSIHHGDAINPAAWDKRGCRSAQGRFSPPVDSQRISFLVSHPVGSTSVSLWP
jgi:hypothetical protein